MKLTSIILLLFIVLNTNQPLNFNDLIFAYENNLSDVTELMNKKEFTFEQTAEENGEKGMVWKYKPENDTNFTLFLAKFCLKKSCGGIHIQTDNKEQYFALKEQALKYGFEYDSSEVAEYEQEDAISFFYYYEDFTLIMSEGKSKGKQSYTITLKK